MNVADPADGSGEDFATEEDKQLSRRKFLIGATATVGAVGVVGAAVPFVRSWQPSARARALGGDVAVDISKLQEGDMEVHEWRGRPVFVIRRLESEAQAIESNLSRLADPDSERSKQPEGAKNAQRSLRKDITVLVGLCTHLGCSPKYVPDTTPQEFDANWQGGFFCPCHGSKFDLIGRVYSAVPAPTNMDVPPHHFVDSTTLVIGSDGVS